MNQPLVQYDVEGPLATITLDSPHNRNALSRALVGGLFECLDRAEADDSSLAELIGMVHQGLAGSAEALIRAYQRRNRPNFVIALDPHANPILGKSEWQG